MLRQRRDGFFAEGNALFDHYSAAKVIDTLKENLYTLHWVQKFVASTTATERKQLTMGGDVIKGGQPKKKAKKKAGTKKAAKKK